MKTKEETKEELKETIQDWFWKKIQRPVKFFWQRRIRGFDDSELWSLDNSLAEYILPRLIAFKEYNTHGCASEFFDEDNKEDECMKWKEVVDKMIFAFKHATNDYYIADIEENKKADEKAQEGFELFGKYYADLWD